MADNSQYEFGLDLYDGNSVRSWAPLVNWAMRPRFGYFRLSLGHYEDDLTLLQQCLAQTSWHLGGYCEVFLAWVPRDEMLKHLTNQLDKVGPQLKLPVSMVFEKHTYKDRKGNKITEWPSVGDLKYLASAIANRGYKVNVCTNLDGLDRLKASGLIDLAATDWWIERYYAWPLQKTEMGVDATLSLLLSKYGIPRERVQFMQTSEAGEYPAGASYDLGADYDRAVSWTFEEVPPVVVPPQPETHRLALRFVDGESQAESVAITLQGSVDQIDVIGFDGREFDAVSEEVPPIEPPPVEPPIEPQVEDAIAYGILRQFGINNGLTRAGKLTPAVVRINQEPDPGPVGEELKKGDPSPVTDSRRAFVQAINDERGAHYVNDTVGAMLINSEGQVESISSVRNFVSWPRADVREGCAPLQCFQSSEDFGKFIDENGKPTVTWKTRPDLIFKCGAVNLDGTKYHNVGDDVDAFSPLTARSKDRNGTGELWLDLKAIEPFPALPCDVTVLPDRITTGDHLYLRDGPAGAILEKIDAGTIVTLYEYRPLGANVWARTKDGWICLLLTDAEGPDFLTTWRLETPPVIPPAEA